jgi:hypothetical protein
MHSKLFRYKISGFFSSLLGVGSPGSNQILSIRVVTSVGGTSAVAVNATFQSVLVDIQNSLTLGLIDNAGLANSFSQKIQAALDATGPARHNILAALENEVRAQSGKHITGVARQVLLQDANSLLNQN